MKERMKELILSELGDQFTLSEVCVLLNLRHRTQASRLLRKLGLTSVGQRHRLKGKKPVPKIITPGIVQGYLDLKMLSVRARHGKHARLIQWAHKKYIYLLAYYTPSLTYGKLYLTQPTKVQVLNFLSTLFIKGDLIMVDKEFNWLSRYGFKITNSKEWHPIKSLVEHKFGAICNNVYLKVIDTMIKEDLRFSEITSPEYCYLIVKIWVTSMLRLGWQLQNPDFTVPTREQKIIKQEVRI